jgi:protein TonB
MKKLLLFFVLISFTVHGKATDNVVNTDTTKAQFANGEAELFKFIGNNIEYPQWAKEHCVGGVVYVSFTVLSSGKIDNIIIKRGVGFGLDDEAIRVIKSTDAKWLSAKSDGKDIDSTVMIPIKFNVKGCKQPTGKKLDELKKKYIEQDKK